MADISRKLPAIAAERTAGADRHLVPCDLAALDWVQSRRRYGRTAEAQDDDQRPVVYVIDQDPATRDIITNLLRSVRLEALTFETAAEFLSALRPAAPSCLVTNTRLPGQSGLDLQTRLGQAGIHVPVIFIADTNDVVTAVRAMKAGAVDVFTTPVCEQDMLDAVMTAIEKDRRRRTELKTINGLHSQFRDLTERERQVMHHVVAGLMNKQIAARLNLSEVTVKIHRGRLMRKMNARSVAGLVQMANLLRWRPLPLAVEPILP